MKKFLIGLTCAATLIGANTIFPPIDASAATIHTTVKTATIIPTDSVGTISPNAADPYDPIP